MHPLCSLVFVEVSSPISSSAPLFTPTGAHNVWLDGIQRLERQLHVHVPDGDGQPAVGRPLAARWVSDEVLL